MEKNANCNNCKSTNYRVLYKENIAQIHQIVECNDCGLMYAYPLDIAPPKTEGKGSSKALIEKEAFSERFGEMVHQKQQIQLKDYLTSIEYVKKLIPTKGKALEIGSARGFFLHELDKRGWEVTGIEPHEVSRKVAKQMFGYNFIPETLENSNLPKNSFDAIFMFHVIEHVTNPSDVISIVYEYLKPGGILVMETPTYDSITYRLLKHRERSIRCDGHLFFFTKKNLREMVERQGFVTLKHSRVGRTLSLERLVWNISVILKNKFIDRILEKLSSVLRLNKARIHLNMGDMQRIYCKK